ncbi:MAG: multidrug efflux SMR transporter [Pseudomonadota bacterium]
MGYVYLSIAVITEVIGTTALKASNEFTRLVPSLVVVAGYVISFYMLTLVLRTIPVGVAYAIWAGIGIALISIVSVILFDQKLDFPAIVGIGLIIAGVATIHLFSKVSVH